MLGGRYRVVRMVSAGANTLIADAEDVELNRPVTIKLVRPELAESAEFRSRFATEMRTMSSVSHPNIAAVHDWGEEQIGKRTTVYVVVEYLSGGSLRDLFDRGRYLDPSQALVVGLEACRGLDFAHRKGLVHTELTPAKLVFGDDRRLRIVDFGLARLLGEHDWSEPATVATHVARYSSPEQALGQPIDGKSDVYSLALILVEAVTGTVPFAARSTVATLSARIGRLMPVSADLGPLASVLEKAGRPEPADRSTAAELGRALVRAAEKLPRPKPIPLLVTALFERRPEPDAPAQRPDRGHRPSGHGRRARRPGAAGAGRRPATRRPVAATPRGGRGRRGRRRRGGRAGAAAADRWSTRRATDEPPHGCTTATPTGRSTSWPPSPARPSRDRPTSSGAEASPARRRSVAPPSSRAAGPTTSRRCPPAGGAAAGWRGSSASSSSPRSPGSASSRTGCSRCRRTRCPISSGSTRTAARAQTAGFDWDLDVEPARSDEEPDPGAIIRTAPAAGEQLAEGEPFLIVVSEGPEFRTLPDFAGLPLNEAETAIAELRLVALPATTQFDETVPAGSVISWSVPADAALVAGGEVLPDTEVALVVSSGPAPRAVPALAGLSVADATAQLEAMQLVAAVGEPVFSDDVATGNVVSVAPDGGHRGPAWLDRHARPVQGRRPRRDARPDRPDARPGPGDARRRRPERRLPARLDPGHLRRGDRRRRPGHARRAVPPRHRRRHGVLLSSGPRSLEEASFDAIG